MIIPDSLKFGGSVEFVRKHYAEPYICYHVTSPVGEKWITLDPQALMRAGGGGLAEVFLVRELAAAAQVLGAVIGEMN